VHCLASVASVICQSFELIAGEVALTCTLQYFYCLVVFCQFVSLEKVTEVDHVPSCVSLFVGMFNHLSHAR
jgi:hypothetical protein